MRFAFVTDELPRPGLAGHLALNHAILGWLLAAGHEVEVLLVRPRLGWPVERYDFAPVAGPGLGVWRHFVFAGSPGDISRILMRTMSRHLPAGLAAFMRRRGRARKYGLVDTVLGAFITPAQAAWCAARLARQRPDAILIDTIFRAALLEEKSLGGINSVLIAHDVFHLRHRALVNAGYNVHPVELPRAMEAALLSTAKSIAAIQPDEAAAIQDMCPARNVFTAPMPALPCPRPPGRERHAGRLVFAGSDSLPNLDGLRWFFTEIWPRLKTWRGNLQLDLVGDCGGSFAYLPPGVNRLGRTKDLSPVLHGASLAISPLRAGSGLKIKLLDYARHGLLTVATPASLQGFAPDAQAPFIAAADAIGFSAAIAARLRLRQSVQDEQRALDYITRHYGIKKSFSGLAGALHLPAELAPQL